MRRPEGVGRPRRGDVVVAFLALAIVTLWTIRALSSAGPADQYAAWLAGNAIWHTGHADSLYSWTGTPVLGSIMALVSQIMSAWTSAVILTFINAFLALGVTWRLTWRLRARAPRPLRWCLVLGILSFAPLMSTVWWKQINLIVFTLALAGFERLRRRGGHDHLAAALIGLSVAYKPLMVLLPLVLLARRPTRRAGLETIAWILAFSELALALAAWRAHSLSVLDPWTVARNFSNKSNPQVFPFLISPDNYAPIKALVVLGSPARWHVYELAVLGLVALLGAWTARALRGRGVLGWETFAFTAAFSGMVSTIEWGHYGILLIPLFVLLALDLVRHRAGVLDWIGPAIAFGVISLVWRPYGTLQATVHDLILHGHLAPVDPITNPSAATESVARWGQFVLVVSALLWYERLAPGVTPVPTAPPASVEPEA